MKINIGTNRGNIVGVEVNKKFDDILLSDIVDVLRQRFNEDCLIYGWCLSPRVKRRPTDYQRAIQVHNIKCTTEEGARRYNFYELHRCSRSTYYRTPIGLRRKSYDNGKTWIENK